MLFIQISTFFSNLWNILNVLWFYTENVLIIVMVLIGAIKLLIPLFFRLFGPNVSKMSKEELTTPPKNPTRRQQRKREQKRRNTRQPMPQEKRKKH